MICCDQVGFIPETKGWFNNQKSINTTHHINKKENTNHMIKPIDAKKLFDKVEHLFMMQVLEKFRIQQTYFNIVKAIYGKTTANITLNV